MPKYEMIIDGREFSVDIISQDGASATVEVNGVSYSVECKTNTPVKVTPSFVSNIPTGTAQSTAPNLTPVETGSAGAVGAPIPGVILEVFVSEGDEVKVGQPVLKMEAMKMENEITADHAGTIEKVLIKVGDTVIQGQDLVVIS